MTDLIDRFVADTQGDYLDCDQEWGAQCVDLPNWLATQYLGLPYSSGNGWAKARNMSRDYASAGWTYIEGWRNFKRGDILSKPERTPGDGGHVVLALSAPDADGMADIFEQNWAGTALKAAGPAAVHRVDVRGFTAAARPPASALTIAPPPTVTVQPGDTLAGIGRKNGITTTAMLGMNQGIVPENLLPGQAVRTRYIVQPGDTLSIIGQKLGAPWEKIAADSGLDDPNVIMPGQALVVVK